MKVNIKSNDGWQTVNFIERNRVNYDDELFYFFEINFISKYWNRREILVGTFENLKLDKNINCFQIRIGHENWMIFLELVENWINTGELFSHEFYNEDRDFFSITLTDQNDAFICSYEKPVVSIIIKDSRITLEFNMIIDYTSISILNNPNV